MKNTHKKYEDKLSFHMKKENKRINKLSNRELYDEFLAFANVESCDFADIQSIETSEILKAEIEKRLEDWLKQ